MVNFAVKLTDREKVEVLRHLMLQIESTKSMVNLYQELWNDCGDPFDYQRLQAEQETVNLLESAYNKIHG